MQLAIEILKLGLGVGKVTLSGFFCALKTEGSGGYWVTTLYRLCFKSVYLRACVQTLHTLYRAPNTGWEDEQARPCAQRRMLLHIAGGRECPIYYRRKFWGQIFRPMVKGSNNGESNLRRERVRRERVSRKKTKMCKKEEKSRSTSKHSDFPIVVARRVEK